MLEFEQDRDKDRNRFSYYCASKKPLPCLSYRPASCTSRRRKADTINFPFRKTSISSLILQQITASSDGPTPYPYKYSFSQLKNAIAQVTVPFLCIRFIHIRPVKFRHHRRVQIIIPLLQQPYMLFLPSRKLHRRPTNFRFLFVFKDSPTTRVVRAEREAFVLHGYDLEIPKQNSVTSLDDRQGVFVRAENLYLGDSTWSN